MRRALVIGLMLFGAARAAYADSVAALALGDEHTCSLQRSGSIACWGRNRWGQLGDGTRIDRAEPVAVSGIDHAVQLATFGARSCATFSDGHVACWGHLGGLVDASDAESPLTPESKDALTPHSIDGLGDVAEIALGGEHICARLRDGSVRCWGSNQHGQLGDGTRLASHVPTRVAGLRKVRALALGVDHSCALLEDRTATCWGANEGGQAGDASLEDRVRPTAIGGLTNIASLVASGGSTCARLENGTARCWGWNHDGQLGDGTRQNHAVPKAVKNLERSVEVALFASGACARHANGSIECWGEGSRAPSLYDDSRRSLVPVEQATLTQITSLAQGGQNARGHQCVVAGQGVVRCWGPSKFGQLGAVPINDRPTRVRVAAPAMKDQRD